MFEERWGKFAMKLNSHKFAYALTVNVMDGSLVEYHDCL